MLTHKRKFIEKVLQLEEIPQSPKWHPEGNTLEHVKFIIYGLTVKKNYGMISYKEYEFLTWVALFHDLGKIDTLTFDDDGNPHAYGHEYKAERYIDNFYDVIPQHIYSVDKGMLKKFCEKHMKAHLMVGTEMRVTKKEAFKDEFTDTGFYLMMMFERCDSVHTLYEFLRRDQRFVDKCYLEPIEFYDEIRENMNRFYGGNFEGWLKQKVNFKKELK